MRKMFLDDIRNPSDIYINNIYPDTFGDNSNWIIIRSYKDACKEILMNGIPEFISFDHDLGVGKTGYDLVKWMIDNGNFPKDFKFNVHSANPVGAANIYMMLTNYLNFISLNEGE